MGMRVKFFKCLALLLCILFTNTAQADALVFEGDYAFSWSGLRLGKLNLQMKYDDENYNVESRLKTSGFVALFSKHKSTTKVSGKTKSNEFQPITYRSDYRSGGHDKSIEMNYDAAGKITKEEILPWRGARPEVPVGLKTKVDDSLTAILSMRVAIKKALANNETEITIPVFDGVRRFDLQARVLNANTSIFLDDKKVPAIKLVLKRIPLGGFKQKEIKKMAKGEPDLEFFIEKENFTLLGFQLDLYGGTVMAWIKDYCFNEACNINTTNVASK